MMSNNVLLIGSVNVYFVEVGVKNKTSPQKLGVSLILLHSVSHDQVSTESFLFEVMSHFVRSASVIGIP